LGSAFLVARLFWGNCWCRITEEQITQYIENQADDPGSFKVWDESETEFEAQGKGPYLKSDSSE